MKAVLFLLFISVALCDVWMHNPRGCGNRCLNDGDNVRNNKRLFDSQGNNRGGYNVGPPMTYYSGSKLLIEWTNQHGCGGNHPTMNCQVVLQYMCDESIRDGVTHEKITLENYDDKDTDDLDGDGDTSEYKYGMHESPEYWDMCRQRPLNTSLYRADQNLGSSPRATRTRQENNNDPHGFECNEERDYYPYWYPTPWRDIAIFASNTGLCNMYRAESQNVKRKAYCSDPIYATAGNCVRNFEGGEWLFVEPWGMAEPECIRAEGNRVNHLGNSRSGETNRYWWTIPELSQEYTGTENGADYAKCVLRIRYNISTDDYNQWRDIPGEGNEMHGDPYIPWGPPGTEEPSAYEEESDEDEEYRYLRLALNTDQHGRTFEDRSCIFFIRPLPNSPNCGEVYNFNVRGKRGNIVQTFPGVEYDFVPNDLTVKQGDCIHFQWTGSDLNPENRAGEGKDRTDRSNIIHYREENARASQPSLDINTQSFFTPEVAFKMAFIGQYDGRVCGNANEGNCCKTLEQLENSDDADEDEGNCGKLNAPGANYFDGGLVRANNAGTFYFLCTRNNNFSNRSQKARIVVE